MSLASTTSPIHNLASICLCRKDIDVIQQMLNQEANDDESLDKLTRKIQRLVDNLNDLLFVMLRHSSHVIYTEQDNAMLTTIQTDLGNLMDNPIFMERFLNCHYVCNLIAKMKQLN